MYLAANNGLEALQEITDVLRGEIDKLSKKADENIPVVMTIGSFPDIRNFEISTGRRNNKNTTLAWPDKWFNFYNWEGFICPPWSQELIDERYSKISSVIDEFEEAQKSAEEANLPAVENNKAIREKISLIMEHLGIPSSYSVYELPSPRSHKKEWVRKTAGWVSDLNRCVPISVQGVKQDISQLRGKLTQMYDKAVSELRVREREKQKEEDKARELHTLALLRAKYCPDNAFADASEVLDFILGKDKYLRLAYYLECTRNDWSEGFGAAEYALSKFVVETQEDQEIYDDISGCFVDEDGRIFRDTAHGYNFLYSKVKDTTLLEDFRIVRQMVS